MAITTVVADSSQMPLELYQTQIQATSYAPPVEITSGDWCWCNYVCKAILPAFSGDTDLTNDKKDFLYARITPADTIVMKLYKEGVLKATLTNDTYGTFYDFGDLTNGNLKGYLLDWGLVHTAFGSGDYQLITTLTVFSNAITIESSYFRLMPYNEQAANRTVRIESYQNGLIESGMDFTGCNWYGQVRVRGHFGNKQPDFVTDNYLSSDRERKQIQDSITNTYTLEILGMSYDEKETFIYQTLLANRLFLTDYSIPNDDKYRKKEVYPDSIEKLTYNKDRPGSHSVIKIRDKKENIIKRNSSF